MSLIFATQLTAIATLALAVLALVAGILAGLALRKQSQEVGLLLEQNKRDTDERRRTQAARVLLGVPPDTGPPVSPYARNASDLPIYEATLRYTGPGRMPEPEHLGTVMPGDTATSAELFSGVQALRRTVLTFRDAAGNHWARWPDGVLVEIGGEPPPGDGLSAIRQLYEVITLHERERDNAAGYPRATGGRLRRAARADLRKPRPKDQE